MTGFQLFCVNCDGCHMWGRKCSLFPEHSFTVFGEFMISSFHYVYGLMTGLFAWISRDCFVSDLFYQDYHYEKYH